MKKGGSGVHEVQRVVGVEICLEEFRGLEVLGVYMTHFWFGFRIVKVWLLGLRLIGSIRRTGSCTIAWTSGLCTEYRGIRKTL